MNKWINGSIFSLHHFFRGRLSAANAIGDTSAAVGVSGELKGGEVLQALADARDAREVAEVILRHRARPFFDVRE
jgi:hypothetical protein